MNLVGKPSYPAKKVHKGWTAKPHYSVNKIRFDWNIDKRFLLSEISPLGLHVEEACDIELAIASIQQRSN